MISIDVLKQVKTVVTHDNCADGLASALILRDALPEAEILFVQYGSKEHVNLKVTPGMLFCDMTPPSERVQAFVAAGAVVLDHHEGARELVERFGERGAYSDEPGVSGAVLAYEQVWDRLSQNRTCMGPQRAVASFARLAGIRDTWQRGDPRWELACAQAAALLWWPRQRWLDARLEQWESMLSIGSTLLEKRAAAAEQAAATACRFEVSGVRVVMFQGADLSSDVKDHVGDEADLVVGFDVSCRNGDNKLWTRYSCRSVTGFDCMAFAQANGGNGQKKSAAGFYVEVHENDFYAVREFELKLLMHFMCVKR